jgi:hypothetical protein
MTKFAISNTTSGLLLYTSKAFREKYGTHFDVNVHNRTVYVRRGGAVTLGTGEHSNADLPCQALIASTLSGEQWGKTEYEATETSDNVFIIDLERPLTEKKPPRKYKNARVENLVQVDPSVADIENALAVINALDRDVYQVRLDSTDNKVQVVMQKTFG